ATVLSPDDIQVLATPDSINQIRSIDHKKLTPGQKLKLRGLYLERYAPRDVRATHREFKLAAQELSDFSEKLPTVMIMEEMTSPRESPIWLRGKYDKPGERVEQKVPGERPPLPQDVAGTLRVRGRATAVSSRILLPNRLNLAKWLVDPANP